MLREIMVDRDHLPGKNIDILQPSIYYAM